MAGRRLILFDIDGTLISPGPIPRETMAAALSAELGEPVTLSFHHVAGSTDPVIVREALLRHGNGLPASSAAVSAVLDRYLEQVEEKLRDLGGVTIFPGARELVQACRKAGWATAIMTGNLERGAAAKLAGTGLWELFDFGIFGDDGHRREDLPYVAAERAWDVLQEAYPAAVTTLIGDTPADARVARQAGMRGLVVCRREEPEWRAAIEAEAPTWVVDDLEDTAALMALLEAA